MNSLPLKHWKTGHTQSGCGPFGIMLSKDEDDRSRVVSISRQESGLYSFYEECDGFFSVEMSASEAMDALSEAIKWIRVQERK